MKTLNKCQPSPSPLLRRPAAAPNFHPFFKFFRFKIYSLPSPLEGRGGGGGRRVWTMLLQHEKVSVFFSFFTHCFLLFTKFSYFILLFTSGDSISNHPGHDTLTSQDFFIFAPFVGVIKNENSENFSS